MKNIMKKPGWHLTVSVIIIVVMAACSSKQTTGDELTELPASVDAENLPVDYEPAPDKPGMAAYYEMEHIKEWYPQRVLPPVFDFNVDLTDKSVVELWLLRNEIFARNGHLFDDAVLRGHFNRYKWYQPIFDVPEFEAQLDEQEQEFVNKVLKRENELLSGRYVKQGKYQLVNIDHAYNMMQFNEVPDALRTKLASNNFAVVPAKHEQLFHVYDMNHYEYIPNFITTDLYLQVLHKHFNTLLQKIETAEFGPLVTLLLADLHGQSQKFQNAQSDAQLKAAAEFATTYLAVGYSLIANNNKAPGNNAVEEELEKIFGESGQGSELLDWPYLQYSQFTPRGNYTKSEELQNYFRCVKWLNSAPIVIDNDERLLSAILIASFIRNSPDALKSFKRYNEAIRFIVGDEDNLSIANLVDILTAQEAAKPSVFTDATRLKELKAKLLRAKVDRIRGKGANAKTQNELDKNTILFTAGRYTFDAEILSRLIHVLRPEQRRPFPKGLDVFAALGNTTAESILLNEYNEKKNWPAYVDSLQLLKKTFTNYDDWEKNIYSKTFEMLSVLNNTDSSYPLFMKTDAWSRRTLSTSLAAWTELKHDMLLYAEQPFGAQAGEGGGPPPPTHVSYVEPNVVFWEKSIELLDFQERHLNSLNLLTSDVKGIIDRLRDIADLLLTVSRKELRKENITADEFSDLSYLGGRIEYLTIEIFGSGYMPEAERHVAVVADVYNFNGTYLEEAVGTADEIYVVAEINGKPYITKGAVFSYYEFTNSSPLTDEDWRARLASGKAPERPVWLKDIIVEVEGLRSKTGYSF